MLKKIRPFLGLLLVAVTVAVFAYYLSTRHYLLRELLHTPGSTVIVLLALYVGWFAALILTVVATLRLCGKTLSVKEDILLNAYATLVNFFVPGQSGPAVRGIYLKKHQQLRYRTFLFATLLYYAGYAVISGVLLLVCSRPWWQTVVGILCIAIVSVLTLKRFEKRLKTDQQLTLTPTAIAWLIGAVVIQAVVQVAIYWVELRAVNSHIQLWQAITYTGAANFALFVALTPGAIGIRESFLLFSRRLHHIPTTTIVSASVLDRAIFFVFLALLFLMTLAVHAKRKLAINQTP